MEYSVVKKININRDRCEKVGAFLYDRTVDALYSETPGFPFPVQIGISEGLTKCEITKGFLRLPFILKSWINSDILLREIDLLKLAMTGKILMHASCVDHTLIVGFPNSGKTYQTYMMVSQGGQLVSEEYTVIEAPEEKNGAWMAGAYKPVMRTCFSARTMKDCGISMSLREKIWLLATTIRAAILPFMFEAVIWKKIPVKITKKSIHRIVYGSSGREITDWRQFAILCENEFPFMSSEFLQAYALASGLDLLAIQKTQREMIRKFVNHVYPHNGK